MDWDYRKRLVRPYRQFESPLAKDYFARLARPVMRSHKNLFHLFVGSPGSGKSITSVFHGLALCHWFGPDNFDDRIIYLPSEFFNAITDIKSIGDVLIWDEFGVGLPRREWYKASNLAVNKVFQVFRGAGSGSSYQGRIFFFLVAPDKDYIDSQAFKLCNAFSPCGSVEDNYYFKTYMLRHDRFTGKVYRPFFRMSKGRVSATVRSWRRPTLTPELVEAYEARSKPSKNKLIQEFIEFGLLDDKSKREFEREFLAEICDEIVKDPKTREECTGLSGRVMPNLVYSFFLGRGISRLQATKITKIARNRVETETNKKEKKKR